MSNVCTRSFKYLLKFSFHAYIDYVFNQNSLYHINYEDNFYNFFYNFFIIITF